MFFRVNYIMPKIDDLYNSNFNKTCIKIIFFIDLFNIILEFVDLL